MTTTAMRSEAKPKREGGARGVPARMQEWDSKIGTRDADYGSSARCSPPGFVVPEHVARLHVAVQHVATAKTKRSEIEARQVQTTHGSAAEVNQEWNTASHNIETNLCMCWSDRRRSHMYL